MNTLQLRQITDFLSTYDIMQINPQTLLLSSKKSKLLVKHHRVDEQDQQIIDIFDKHLSFDPEYVCPLLHFQRCISQEGDSIIRAVYQLDKMTLKQFIDVKKPNLEYLPESQIWILLSSLVNSLIYLQQKDVIYGVLSPQKIFIQQKIRVMDPSAFNINPVNVSRLSLQSPQIRLNKENIDFFMSDVYLLGLCILSAATLENINNSIGEEELDVLIGIVQQKYSEDLLHVLKYMLKFQSEERPTYENIREYIQTQIQIRQAKQGKVQPLNPDEQDNLLDNNFVEEMDVQNVDVLEVDEMKQHQINQYEQARQKYLYTSRVKTYNPVGNASTIQSIQNMESIQFIGHKQTKNNYIQQFRLAKYGSQSLQTISKNKKRIYQIKNRNSEAVKAIHSIIIPNHHESTRHSSNPFTSPQLLSILDHQKRLAQQYFQTSRRKYH